MCAYGRWFVTCRLLTTDGDLLGTTAEVGRMEQEHIIAAIMSNVFGEYERAGNECLGEPNLKFLLFSFEVRRGAVRRGATRRSALGRARALEARR